MANKVFNSLVSLYSSKEEQGMGKEWILFQILILIINLPQSYPLLYSYIKEVRTYASMAEPDSKAKKMATYLKGLLPCFTPTGVFKTKTRNGLVKPSNLIIADIDDIDLEQYEKLNEELRKDKYVAFFFLSPSGQGLKIGFNVAFTDLDSFNAAMSEVSSYLNKEHNLTVDPSTFNINRLCYISYDPNLYVNPNVEELPVSEKSRQTVAEQKRNSQIVCQQAYKIPDNINEVRSNPTNRENFNKIVNYWLKRIATTEHPGRHEALYNGAARLGNFSWFFSSKEGLETLRDMFIEAYLNNHNGPDKERKEAERTFDDGFKIGNQPERQCSLD